MNEFLETVNKYSSVLGGVLTSFSVADAVDIIAVAIIIYQILRFARETRAAQLLKGVVFIVVIAFFSNLFGLKMLSMMMQNIVSLGVIAVAILFQPELRRALEKMGGVGKTNIADLFATPDEHILVIKQIITATERLSKTKTGALIVVERGVKLGEAAETGTFLDAAVSAELLCNVFFKNSPLHDGAVILRGNKVLSAGCFLTPTDNDEYIAKELGARHRAAIGISEISDCVVIVVSEETGMISVAEAGKLTRNVASDRLSALLLQRLSPVEPENKKGGRLRGLFKK
jgi:TIGR00159 family protein